MVKNDDRHFYSPKSLNTVCLFVMGNIPSLFDPFQSGVPQGSTLGVLLLL